MNTTPAHFEPSTFEVNRAARLTTVRHHGRQDIRRMQREYDFYYAHVWRGGLKELVDLSSADLTRMNGATIRALVEFVNPLLRARGLTSQPLAIVAPDDVSYGFGRVVEAIAAQTIGGVSTFRSAEAASAWIQEQTAERPPRH